MLQQLDTFVGPEIGWFALSPMLTLLGGALILMLLGALTPPWPRGLYALGAAVTAVTAGALAMVQWDDITDNGPITLVGRRDRLRPSRDVHDDHDLCRRAARVVAVGRATFAGPRTTVRRSTRCTSSPPSAPS